MTENHEKLSEKRKTKYFWLKINKFLTENHETIKKIEKFFKKRNIYLFTYRSCLLIEIVVEFFLALFKIIRNISNWK